MGGPAHLNPKTYNTTTMHSLYQIKVPSSSSSSSSLSSMKIKTLIHTLIISRVARLVRALSKAKTILVEHLMYPHKNSKHYKRKIFFGSFRLHYNWGSSSHVMPIPAPIMDEYLYYESSTWNSVVPLEDDDDHQAAAAGGADSSSSQLSGYLQWLEDTSSSCSGEQDENEIDKLADMFIANCHEKFRLEKVESYRRYQEMLARSM